MKKQTIPISAGEQKCKSFLDMVAPGVVKFSPDHFICGNTYRCVWALREYPTSTDEQAILRHLGELDGVTLHIYNRQVMAVEEDTIFPRSSIFLLRTPCRSYSLVFLANSNLCVALAMTCLRRDWRPWRYLLELMRAFRP